MIQQAKSQQAQFRRGHLSMSHGYLLPIVIALGLGVGTIGMYAMRSVADNSMTLNNQYYKTLAREAAQAGIAAVKSCVLSQPASWVDSIGVTFTEPNPLTPMKKCDGTTATGGVNYIANDTAFSSTYKVTQIAKYPSSATTLIVTSVGEVHIKSSTGSIVQTYSKSIRAIASSVSTTGSSGKSIAHVSAGPATACAVSDAPDSWVYCWGSNGNGMLGTGGWNYKDNRSRVPVAVTSGAVSSQPSTSSNPCDNNFWTFDIVDCAGVRLASAMNNKKVLKVSVGTNHVCAIAKDNTDTAPSEPSRRAYCWGSNNFGQLGTRTAAAASVPTAVDTQMHAAAIPAVCIGFACTGGYQPAIPERPASALIDASGNPKTVTDITAGNDFTCALTSDGLVACWGKNDHGQLGSDNRTNYSYPVSISYHTTARQGDVCLTRNFWGNCTSYNVVPSSALVGKQIQKLAAIKDAETMCALDTNQKAYCWGENYAGQTGDDSAIPPSTSGTGEERHSNANQCNVLRKQAFEEAARNASPAVNRDALRPVEVVTALKFDHLTVIRGATGYDEDNIDAGTGTNPVTRSGSRYVYVTAKTSAAEPSYPNRMYYWGGEMSWSATIDCYRNGDTYGSDWSRGDADMTRTYSGETTPAGPLYSTSADGQLNNSLGLVSGNAVKGLFCATVLNLNQPYCDVHGGAADEGQLGNNYTCTPNFYGGGCSQTWHAPQSVRLDIARDTDGPVNPANISTKSISGMDTGSSGYTCIVAQGSAYCWGVNAAGQLGDGSTTNRSTPSVVNYASSPLGVPAAGSGTGSATWESPLWF